MDSTMVDRTVTGERTVRRRINPWAVLVAAAVPLVTSAAYYIVFGGLWLSLRGLDPNTVSAAPHPWEIGGQFVRNVVVAFVLATLLARLRVTGWRGALRVGLLVWVGFQAMEVIGAVLHENYPVGLYVLHVVDALMTTLVMAFVLGAWRRDRS